MTIRTENGEEATLEWERVRCFDKEVAGVLLAQVKEIKETTVLSIVSKEKSKPRPLALNTVELMRVASSGNYSIITLHLISSVFQLC